MRKCRGSPLPPHPLLRVINVYKPLSPPAQGLSPYCCPFPAHLPGPRLLFHPSQSWGGCRGHSVSPCLPCTYNLHPMTYPPTYPCPCKYAPPNKTCVCSLLLLHLFLGEGRTNWRRRGTKLGSPRAAGRVINLTKPDKRMVAVCV